MLMHYDHHMRSRLPGSPLTRLVINREKDAPLAHSLRERVYRNPPNLPRARHSFLVITSHLFKQRRLQLQA